MKSEKNKIYLKKLRIPISIYHPVPKILKPIPASSPFVPNQPPLIPRSVSDEFNNATMHMSTYIGLLPLLAALTTATPVFKGAAAPLAVRDDASSASMYTVDKVGPTFLRIDDSLTI